MLSLTAPRCARPLLLVAIAAAALLATGCARAPRPAEPHSVVLISIDTLRADRLPAWGYRGVATPAIDRLAGDAIRFADAWAPYPLTLPSHVSLLTGLLPPHHGVRDNVGYPFDGAAHPALARRLAGAGFDTAAFVSSYVLRADTGLSDGFATYDAPGLGRTELLDLAQRPGAATVAAAREWLAARGQRPFFLFVHLYEPHAPYDPPEPFKSRYADPYDGEIATADAALAPLFEDLRARGLWDAAAIALVGDHGEGLGDHGESKHGVFLYRSTLHVPLLLKLPGQRRAGEVVGTPVGLVDVAPTLLALAGLPAPTGLDGLDLAGRLPAERGQYAETFYPRLHFGWSDLRAWNESRWSLLDGPRAELFDLAADPGQTRDVLATQRRQAARMRAEIAARDAPLAAPAETDAETARQLAALGYLSGAAAAGDGALPDPREQKDLLAELDAGFEAYFRGDDAGALAHLQPVLARNPRMRDVWSWVARSLDRLGRTAEALAAWDRVLELAGGDAGTALLVGERRLAAGDVERARQLAEIGARQLPERAEELFAEIDLAAGRTAEANARLERAVAAGGASETARRRVALGALARGDAARAVEVLRPLESAGAPESWILLALALSDAGHGEEAVALLGRARSASRPEAAFFENLGIALLSLDRLDRARTALEETVRRDPKSASAWNTLGVVLARSGEPQRAVAAWRNAVAADPRLLDAWFNLGLTAASGADHALARDALRRYLALAPPGGRFAADRARAEKALGALGAGG